MMSSSVGRHRRLVNQHPRYFESCCFYFFVPRYGNDRPTDPITSARVSETQHRSSSANGCDDGLTLFSHPNPNEQNVTKHGDDHGGRQKHQFQGHFRASVSRYGGFTVLSTECQHFSHLKTTVFHRLKFTFTPRLLIS